MQHSTFALSSNWDIFAQFWPDNFSDTAWHEGVDLLVVNVECLLSCEVTGLRPIKYWLWWDQPLCFAYWPWCSAVLAHEMQKRESSLFWWIHFIVAQVSKEPVQGSSRFFELENVAVIQTCTWIYCPWIGSELVFTVIWRLAGKVRGCVRDRCWEPELHFVVSCSERRGGLAQPGAHDKYPSTHFISPHSFYPDAFLPWGLLISTARKTTAVFEQKTNISQFCGLKNLNFMQVVAASWNILGPAVIILDLSECIECLSAWKKAAIYSQYLNSKTWFQNSVENFKIFDKFWSLLDFQDSCTLQGHRSLVICSIRAIRRKWLFVLNSWKILVNLVSLLWKPPKSSQCQRWMWHDALPHPQVLNSLTPGWDCTKAGQDQRGVLQNGFDNAQLGCPLVNWARALHTQPAGRFYGITQC